MISREHELAKILIERNLIKEDELPEQNIGNDAVEETILEEIETYLKNSPSITKSEIHNILQRIKDKSMNSEHVRLTSEFIKLCRSDYRCPSESLLLAVNELLSPNINLVTLYNLIVSGETNPHRQTQASRQSIDSSFEKLGLTKELRDEIQRNSQSSGDDNTRKYKVICNYSNMSKSIALTITNGDTVGSIPGVSFINIFTNVTNAILTKNNIQITRNPSSQKNLTENKAKYILLMMNELDRLNLLKEMPSKDKEIFAKFFEQLPRIDESQLISINEIFKKLYEDQESSPELKFKQLVMHLTSLFDKDMNISVADFSAITPTDDLTQANQNLLDDQKFAELFYDFTSQGSLDRHQILESFKNGDDSLFSDPSLLGISKELLKEKWQNADFDLVPPPPPRFLPGHSASAIPQDGSKGYYFKKEIEIDGHKISLTLDSDGLKKGPINISRKTPANFITTPLPVVPSAKSAPDIESASEIFQPDLYAYPIISNVGDININGLNYSGEWDNGLFKGAINITRSKIYFEGSATVNDDDSINLRGKVFTTEQISPHYNDEDIDKRLFSIDGKVKIEDFREFFNEDIFFLPKSIKYFDSTDDREFSKIGDLIFLGKFTNQNKFSGIIYSPTNPEVYFQGIASTSNNFKDFRLVAGNIIKTANGSSEVLFEIGSYSQDQELNSIFSSKLDLPFLLKNADQHVDQSAPYEIKKIGGLYFLGNFFPSGHGEIFQGLILKNDDKPFFFSGSAMSTDNFKSNIILTGHYKTKNNDHVDLTISEENDLNDDLIRSLETSRSNIAISVAQPESIVSSQPVEQITPIIGRDHPFAQLLIEKGLISHDEFPVRSEVDQNHDLFIEFIYDIFNKPNNNTSINKEDIIDLLNLIKSSEINENTQLKIFDLGKLCNDKRLSIKQTILAINEISKPQPDYNKLAIFMELDQSFYNRNITKFTELGITQENVLHAEARVAQQARAQEAEARAQEARSQQARAAQENARVGCFRGLFRRVMQRQDRPNTSPGIMSRINGLFTSRSGVGSRAGGR